MHMHRNGHNLIDNGKNQPQTYEACEQMVLSQNGRSTREKLLEAFIIVDKKKTTNIHLIWPNVPWYSGSSC